MSNMTEKLQSSRENAAKVMIGKKEVTGLSYFNQEKSAFVFYEEVRYGRPMQ